jgi:hypothetical protein
VMELTSATCSAAGSRSRAAGTAKTPTRSRPERTRDCVKTQRTRCTHLGDAAEPAGCARRRLRRVEVAAGDDRGPSTGGPTAMAGPASTIGEAVRSAGDAR